VDHARLQAAPEGPGQPYQLSVRAAGVRKRGSRGPAPIYLLLHQRGVAGGRELSLAPLGVAGVLSFELTGALASRGCLIVYSVHSGVLNDSISMSLLARHNGLRML